MHPQTQLVERDSASEPSAATADCVHSVNFYEDDFGLLESLSEFVGAALGAGGSAIVIATGSHRRGLTNKLKEYGIDLRPATENKRFIALDAEETLARFMVEEWPDGELFRSVVEPELLAARAGLAREKGPVVAFGEMVALLWADGKRDAAIRLEQLWNELARTCSFSLRCAYPIGTFGADPQGELFRKICAEHSNVIPTEGYTSLDNEGDRLRMVSALQQKAQVVRALEEARMQEMTRREQVERDLRRSEDFARHVIESSIDSVKVLDLDGRLAYISPPGLKALEIEDISQFLGRPWVDFWREADRPRATAALETAKAGGVGSFQGDCLTPAGTQKSWDIRISPARGADGSVEQLIVVCRDTTELRLAQQAAIQAEKLATAGRQAATIAHEINNPLEAVTNFIYLAMTNPDVPEVVCQQLAIADRELTRVAAIARQTLGFYKDNSKHSWISVAELIDDVLTIYDRKMRNKHLEVRILVDPKLTVYAKHGELKQALSNLVANAIDASHDCGKLWLRAQATKKWSSGMEAGVRITLADNGSGMPPEVQRRIFVPFFTTKSEIGTGIGLWVTKCLVEQQGGFLRFRSRQGQKAGTVMSFFLPQTRHENRAASTQGS